MAGTEKPVTDYLLQYAPKYRVIANRLREQINKKGDYAPKQRFLSESQLVEQFQVSRATIRQALDVLVQENLLERRQGQGTFIADGKSETHQTTLVFSYPDISSLRHPYIGGLYDSFESEVNKWASQNQHEISVQCVRQAKSQEHGHFSLLHTDDPIQAQMVNPQHIQGLCLTTTIPEEEIAEIQKRGIRCVTIGGTQDYEFPSVYIHPMLTKKLAIMHLKELGHRNIGLVLVGHPIGDTEREALAQLEKLGDEMGLNIGRNYNIFCADYKRQLAFEAAMESLKRLDRPTAIYCYDDFLALGVRDAAMALGLSVPGDLSIVGTGNYIPESKLTTVQTPLSQMGQAAARMLTGLVFGSYKGEFHVSINDCELITGETAGPPQSRA